MVYIYILQLENDKYYIGRTENPAIRLDAHFNSNGAAWTKKYKPKNVIQPIPDCDNFDEDKYTIQYMEKYGINNVRGGSFCEFVLSKQNIATIEQMIKNVTDSCYKCGNKGHYAKECNKKPDENCNCITSYISTHKKINCALNKMFAFFNDNKNTNVPNKNTVVPENEEPKKIFTCYRCGRTGHIYKSCYAYKHINGTVLQNKNSNK
jgi:cellular nucleic acid-binding protein